MKTRIVTAAALMVCVLTLHACTNTQPAYYGTYPSDFDFGPNHGYEPYASAPHDPYSGYYQNFAPATPYYYEPPESHRDCDERPCIAYQRHAETPPMQPAAVASPSAKPAYHPPSTISRSPHSAAPLQPGDSN